MSIRARLTLILAGLFAILLGMSLLTIVTARRNEESARLTQQYMKQLDNIYHFGIGVSQVMKDIFDAVAGADEDDGGGGGGENSGATSAALALVLADARHGGEAEEIERAREMALLYRELLDLRARVVTLAARGQRDEALRLLAEQSERIYEDRFVAVLAASRLHEEEEVAALVEGVLRRAGATLFAELMFVALGLVALLVSSFMGRRLQRRLGNLIAAVRRMGSGALDARVADTGPRDELGELGHTFDRMAADVGQLLNAREEKDALAQELALAARMQASILPRDVASGAIEVSGSMFTATEVGGDYYDVQVTDDGGWIAIGDVSGHGFNAGLVMMMAQSALSAAIATRPDAGPADLIRAVNRVLYDNVKTRLGLHEHMTLSLLRYWNDGRILFAGAHQDLLVREPDGQMQVIETEGTWLGLIPDLGSFAVDREIHLAPGAAIVLFTDGITESSDRDGSLYGTDRLTAVVGGASRHGSAAELCAEIVGEVKCRVPRFDDDATLLVLRRPCAAETTASLAA